MEIDVKDKNSLREILKNLCESDVLIVEDGEGERQMVFANYIKGHYYHLTDYGMQYGNLEYMHNWLLENEVISLGCYGINELKITV